MRTPILVVVMALALTLPVPVRAAAPQPDKPVHSKIEGQLVPVGEHNKYEYAYKENLISTNPLTWYMGTFGVAYTRALNQYFAVRGEVDFIHFYKTSIYGAQFMVSLPIFFKKMNDGFYLEPGAFFLPINDDSGSAVAGGLMTMLGWSWIWDSGFNINLGFGMTYTWISAQVEDESESVDGPLPTGRLQFGYAF